MSAGPGIVLADQPKCNPGRAKSVSVAALATDPAAFQGKCVRLKGYWRDIGIYPTAGEAGQPDALSVIFLDERRVGLYMSDEELALAPKAPALATLVGIVGDCVTLPKGAVGKGYCAYKHGAYMFVLKAELAK